LLPRRLLHGPVKRISRLPPRFINPLRCDSLLNMTEERILSIQRVARIVMALGFPIDLNHGRNSKSHNSFLMEEYQ